MTSTMTNAQRMADKNRQQQERQAEEAKRRALELPVQKVAKVEPARRRPRRRVSVRLSAAIMAHPARQEQVDYLLNRLDRDVPVVWDEIGNRWDTGRRSMLAADPDCTHHMVIQDDVLIPFDLLAGLERALSYIPAHAPLCGYIGRLRPQNDRVLELVERARLTKASFITLRKLNWGPLIAVPTKSVIPMIELCDKLDIENYDLRLSRYWEGLNTPVWYSFPCLVDHADGPSLVPGRNGVNRKRHTAPSRVAHEFCGENISALNLKWNGPVIHGR